jgi:hypothetical protein
VVTDDLYTAAADAVQFRNSISGVGFLTTGWHTMVITTLTKNASSSGQSVGLAAGRSFTREPDQSTMLVPCESGQPTYVNDYWTTAVVDRVLSGTPVLRWKPGDVSITLTGGDAMVRLWR